MARLYTRELQNPAAFVLSTAIKRDSGTVIPLQLPRLGRNECKAAIEPPPPSSEMGKPRHRAVDWQLLQETHLSGVLKGNHEIKDGPPHIGDGTPRASFLLQTGANESPGSTSTAQQPKGSLARFERSHSEPKQFLHFHPQHAACSPGSLCSRHFPASLAPSLSS